MPYQVVLVIVSAAYFIYIMFLRKDKTPAFRDYVIQNFSDLPEDTKMFAATQMNKKSKLDIFRDFFATIPKEASIDIALLFNDSKKEIILLLVNKREKLKHKVFPFKNLTSVESSDRILSSGVLLKTYKFEQTMVLKFKDGSSYNFILEIGSNKYGKAFTFRGKVLDENFTPEQIRRTFAPWEEKLKIILN